MTRRLALCALFAAALAHAALLRIEETERSPVLDGKPFGAAGPYERIVGRAYFAVDPALAANRIVADLDKAPRNAGGMVEFSAGVYILRPRDLKRGNGALLFEVSNRGGKGMLGMFDRAAGSRDPRTERELGDDFLLEQGYTLVWLGWQFDAPEVPALMRAYLPVAKGVRGVVRAEFVDGIMAHVAGAGRGSFNIRFAQPSRDGHPFFNTLYPTDIFPFHRS